MKRGIASLAFLAALAAAPQAALAHGGHDGGKGFQEKPPPVLSAGAPAPFLNLPATFTKSVRGCTADGRIVRLFYNIAVDGNDLAAAQNADLTLEPQARLGARGGDIHIDRIKNLTTTIHAAMQEQTGSLLDRARSEDLATAAFTKTLESTTQKIADDTKTNHQIGVILKISTPQKTDETCPAAP